METVKTNNKSNVNDFEEMALNMNKKYKNAENSRQKNSDNRSYQLMMRQEKDRLKRQDADRSIDRLKWQ